MSDGHRLSNASRKQVPALRRNRLRRRQPAVRLGRVERRRLLRLQLISRYRSSPPAAVRGSCSADCAVRCMSAKAPRNSLRSSEAAERARLQFREALAGLRGELLGLQLQPGDDVRLCHGASFGSGLISAARGRGSALGMRGRVRLRRRSRSAIAKALRKRTSGISTKIGTTDATSGFAQPRPCRVRPAVSGRT